MRTVMATKGLSLLLLQTVAAMPALNARDGITCPTANSTVVAIGGKNWSIECGLDTYQGDMPAPNGQSYSTFDQCIQSCVSRSGCQSVAYMGQACYLKGSIPKRVPKASVWGAVLVSSSSASASGNDDCLHVPQSAVAGAASAAPAAASARVFGQVASVPAAAAPAASAAAVAPQVVDGSKEQSPQSYAAAAPSAAASTGGSTSGDGSCARPAAKSLSTKRGVSYNDIGMVAPFAGKVSWAYNWGSTAGGTLPSGIEYIPMLWSPGNGGAQWSGIANAAVAAGADTLLGFNEPDQTGQAQMTVDAAVAGWKQYMEPLKCKARLASPAVTNGGAPMGLTYLKNFLAACTGCTIDVAVIHWYDSASNFAYFKQYISDAYAAAGNRPLWITEFGASGSDADQEAFFKQALPFLDSTPYVERYAYFMASAGKLVTSSKQLSAIGQAYVS